MTGNNTIILNQATMQKAVQHYFDTVIFKDGIGVKVTGIKKNTNGGGDTFEVSTTGEERLIPFPDLKILNEKQEETNATATR